MCSEFFKAYHAMERVRCLVRHVDTPCSFVDYAIEASVLALLLSAMIDTVLDDNKAMIYAALAARRKTKQNREKQCGTQCSKQSRGGRCTRDSVPFSKPVDLAVKTAFKRVVCDRAIHSFCIIQTSLCKMQVVYAN
jgi:hypothetical protein